MGRVKQKFGRVPLRALPSNSRWGGSPTPDPGSGGCCATSITSSFPQLPGWRSPPLPGSQLRWRAVRKRTAKNRWTDQKMNAFIFWLALGFSYARKLSLRFPSYRRKLFVFLFCWFARCGSRGFKRPENDSVDHNPGLRPAQANSESGLAEAPIVSPCQFLFLVQHSNQVYAFARSMNTLMMQPASRARVSSWVSLPHCTAKGVHWPSRSSRSCPPSAPSRSSRAMPGSANTSPG